MPLNDNQKPLVRELYAVQEELRRVKRHESELRSEVISLMLDDNINKPGTYKEELGNGVSLSVTIPKRVEVNKEVFDQYKGELEQKGLIGEEGVIQMKPSVSVTAMKYMSAEDKVRFADLFVTKTGAASVKFDMGK